VGAVGAGDTVGAVRKVFQVVAVGTGRASAAQ
jgi:hypothetical protein